MSRLPEPVITPLPWDQLDPGERRARWSELCQWVEWFVRRYPVESDIPPCWHQHPAVVDELTALWVAHAGAWYPGMAPNAPLGWLEQLDRSLARIRRWIGSCTSAEHRPATRARWITDVDHFVAIDQAEPPPTDPFAVPAPSPVTAVRASAAWRSNITVWRRGGWGAFPRPLSCRRMPFTCRDMA